MSKPAHNVVSGEVNADHLKAFLERIERLHEERASLSTDISEVYSEAKGHGYDVPVMKEIVKRRAKDPDKRHEFESVLEVYIAAVGLL